MSSNKRVVAGGLALILSAAAHAQTGCPCGAGTVVGTTPALRTLLVGKTVCAAQGNDTWQEYHDARGVVTDYKRGPNDPVDPSKSVAAFSINNAGGGTQITYDYGGGQVYSYTVCQNGASVNFCGTRNIVGATLLTGQGPCPAIAQANQAKTKGL